MVNTSLENLFWKFPHALRRALYLAFYPSEFRLLIKLRTAEPEQLNIPTFKPFIDQKCIFVHIPKAAGMSIGYGIFGRHTGNHTTIAEYQIAFSRKEFADFFKFTFVRNPWDRLVSAYVYLKRGGRNKDDFLWAAKHLSSFASFEDFVLRWVNKENVRNGLHFRPQHHFITNPGSRLMRVDYVGHFETIDSDYRFIQERLGSGAKLNRVNMTNGKRSDYRSYYNDRTRDIVADTYSEDIDLLGYDFNNESLKGRSAN